MTQANVHAYLCNTLFEHLNNVVIYTFQIYHFTDAANIQIDH